MAASVQVIFAGDTRNLDGAFGRVRGEVGKTESTLGKFKKFAGPAMLGGAVAGVAVFKDALGGLRAEAEATKTLQATLTSMGRTEISTDEISKFASNLQANSDFIEEDIIKNAGLMATFGNIADKDLGKANQAAADLAARFDMDLGSATTMLGKALNDPVKGLTALGRAGVQFTEQQKEQIAAMVAVGDEAGAQELILAELEKQTKGAAAAQQDSFEKLQDTLGETAESLVGKLMPAIEKTVGWITSAVETFDKMSPAGKNVVLAVGGITAALWLLNAHPIVLAFTVIIGTLITLEQKFGIVSKAANWLGDRFTDLKGVALGMAEFLVGAFRQIVGAALTFAEVVVGAAARAFGWVPGLGEKLRGAEQDVRNFKAGANAALDGIHKELTIKANTHEAKVHMDRLRDHWKAVKDSMALQLNFSAAGGLSGPRRAAGDGPGGPIAPRGGRVIDRLSKILPSYPGTRITSGYRSPAANRAAGGSPTSYHLDARNPAIDVGGPAYQLDRLHGALRQSGGWRELLWRVKGHYDHLHVAHQGGTVSPSWPSLPGLRADERPAILQVGERVLPNAAAGQGGGPIVVVLQVDGREMARVVNAHNDRGSRYGAVMA